MNDLQKVATENEVELVIVDEKLASKDVIESDASALTTESAEYNSEEAIHNQMEMDSGAFLYQEDEAKPLEVQEQSALKTQVDVDEALKVLNLSASEDLPTMLKTFEKQIRASIDNKKTHLLKGLTNNKNVILRSEIEKMIEANGRFDLSKIIPFEEVCKSCNGSGELYRFYRIDATVPCKFCTDGNPEDNGYVFIPCRACKGTKRYKKQQKDLTINVDCTRCYQDPETGLATGLERVKCRACLGKATFRKMVIDAKIKSTTRCSHCKGRGFNLPDPPPKKVKAAKTHKPRTRTVLANPVISADLGAQLKEVDVKE